MASANADLVREAIDSFNREGPETLRRFVHADAVSYPFPEWPDQREYRGSEGTAEIAAQWTELFDEYRWEIRTFWKPATVSWCSPSTPDGRGVAGCRRPPQ